jgi:ribosome biogenesis GTPase
MDGQPADADATDRSFEALQSLGWDDGFETAFRRLDEAGREANLQPGRVVAVHRARSIVRTARGDLVARLAGRFRREVSGPADHPAVGDWVALEAGAGGGPSAVRAVLDRRGALVRIARDAARRGPAGAHDEQVLAANVDVVFVVDAFGSGPNLRRIERYLALAWSAHARPIVVLNKVDLAGTEEAARARDAVAAIAPGVAVILAEAQTRGSVAQLAAAIGPARTAVVVGPSGTGKSTIVNGLLGERRQATRAVRAGDRRGRHTTTVRELFELPGGGLIIDTPGIRSLELAGHEAGLDETFSDIVAIARGCRFADCRHEGDPGCAMPAAIAAGQITAERLANARRLASEAVRRSTTGSADGSDRKRRDKLIARAVRQHYRLKDRPIDG